MQCITATGFPFSTPPSFSSLPLSLYPLSTTSLQRKTGLQETTTNCDQTKYNKTRQKHSHWGRTRQHNQSKRVPRVPTVKSPTQTPSKQSQHIHHRIGVDPCMPMFAASVSVSPCEPCLSGSCSPGVLQSLCLLQSFLPLLPGVPKLWWERPNGDIQVTLSPSRLSGCGSLHRLTSAAGESLFDDDWTGHRPVCTDEYH